MPQAKTPLDSALWEQDSIDPQYLQKLEQYYLNSNLFPALDDDLLLAHMANDMSKKYSMDLDRAKLLIAGGLSNPYNQREGLADRSFGVFKSNRTKDTNGGLEDAKKIKAKNPDKWGVVYGYQTKDGRHYQLVKPFFVNDQQEINKYAKAISDNRNGETRVQLKAYFDDPSH